MTCGAAPSILPADFRKLSENPRFHPADSESFSLNYEAARSLLYRSLLYRSLLYRSLLYRSLLYRSLLYRSLLWEVMASCSLEGPESIRKRTVNEIK